MLRIFLFLSIVFVSSMAHTSSWRNSGPEVYTVDAMEVNWRYHWGEKWQGMNKVKVPKISFCQLVYWKAIRFDHVKDVPRKGWKSEGYTMFEIKKEKGKYIREVSDFQRKVTYPRKNHNDGYWYVTVKDGHHTIKVRAKILLGGLNGTDTIIDPEAEDRNKRNWDHRSPMSIHKEIVKFHQDVAEALLARRQQAEAQEEPLDQENSDLMEPVPLPSTDLDAPVLNHP